MNLCSLESNLRQSVFNLGFILDSDFKFDKQINYKEECLPVEADS